MAHDVYISYSSPNGNVADAVCAKLEERKIRCWIAPRDVPPGLSYATSIVNAIDESRIIVLVFSTSSNNSRQVMHEAERAGSRGIPILTFRVENVMRTPAMEKF